MTLRRNKATPGSATPVITIETVSGNVIDLAISSSAAFVWLKVRDPYFATAWLCAEQLRELSETCKVLADQLDAIPLDPVTHSPIPPTAPILPTVSTAPPLVSPRKPIA